MQNVFLHFIYGIRRRQHIVKYEKAVVLSKYTTDIRNLNTRFRGHLSPSRHISHLFKRSFTYQKPKLMNVLLFQWQWQSI